jgi:hypothetical protein
MALAASEFTPEQIRRLIWASLIIVGLIIAAFVAVSLVRRRLKEGDASASSGGTGFTLSDLRRMHKAGQMSDREFELAKAKIVESAKRASEREANPIRARRLSQDVEVESKPKTPDVGDEPGA